MFLHGKVVVVSGIGPGLGRSIALRAADAGADVVLAARTQETLDAVAHEIADRGRKALVVRTDITDEQSAQNLLDSTVEHFGAVDALVNNAFALPAMKRLANVDLDHLRTAFETNAVATLRLTRIFAPALERTNGAVVVVNSSVLRHSRMPYGDYKMVKASVLAMAQALATELGPHGVRVNSVAPGWIWEPKLQWYFDHLAGKRGVTPQEVYDEHAALCDLRRLPQPDEIANAVLFLASDLASGITGQCLDVNCGEYHH